MVTLPTGVPVDDALADVSREKLEKLLQNVDGRLGKFYGNVQANPVLLMIETPTDAAAHHVDGTLMRSVHSKLASELTQLTTPSFEAKKEQQEQYTSARSEPDEPKDDDENRYTGPQKHR